MEFLSSKEIEKMSSDKKIEYYDRLNKYCSDININIHSKDVSKKLIAHISPLLRNYDLEIYGEENLPLDDSAVFICNHSNSHDFFTTEEVFDKLGRKVTPFGADDCLDFFSLQLFKAGDVTLIDRDDKESSLNGIMNFSKKIIDGEDGVIFAEGTWNLHPILPMQPIKAGGTQTAMIADKVVIPTVYEYVEIPDLCSKEKELYTKCIVIFGKPIIVKRTDNLFEKTKEIQNALESMRKDLWKKIGLKKSTIDQINPELYINHTYLKKFGALGFTFDSEHEFKYLLKKKDGSYENEFIMDESGSLIPGINKKIK